MIVVKDVVYIAAIASILYVIFRIERRLSDLFMWLEDYGALHEALLIRFDRLIGVISELSAYQKDSGSGVSDELFEETVERTREEICSIIVRDFTTKSGKLKKSVAAKIFDEVAKKVAEHKSKDA